MLYYDRINSNFLLENLEFHLINQDYKEDEKTLKSLFDKYYTCLLLYANSIINNIDTSKDIVQDIFLKLWEKHKDFTIKSSVKSYLYTAVRNSCLDYFKHQQVEKIYIDHSLIEMKEIELDYYDKLFPTPNEDKTEIYLKEINLAIESLPEQCKKIFKLSRFEGMKNYAVAKHLNLSIRTVDTQIYRALKKLRQKLDTYLSCK